MKQVRNISILISLLFSQALFATEALKVSIANGHRQVEFSTVEKNGVPFLVLKQNAAAVQEIEVHPDDIKAMIKNFHELKYDPMSDPSCSRSYMRLELTKSSTQEKEIKLGCLIVKNGSAQNDYILMANVLDIMMRVGLAEQGPR